MKLRQDTVPRMFEEWIAKGLKKPGKDQYGLADALGVERTAVSKLINRKRLLKADEIEKVAAYIEEPPPSQIAPVRYLIGAGQEIIGFPDDEPIAYESVGGMWGVEFELAIVRGDSMWPMLNDGDRLFIGPSRNPSPTDHNQRRVVRLADDRLFVKVMKRSLDPAVWTLESFNFPPIEDVVVLAVASIIRIEPRQ
jgi:transcriptional regulator with XRE-family HTH domain